MKIKKMQSIIMLAFFITTVGHAMDDSLEYERSYQQWLPHLRIMFAPEMAIIKRGYHNVIKEVIDTGVMLQNGNADEEEPRSVPIALTNMEKLSYWSLLKMIEDGKIKVENASSWPGGHLGQLQKNAAQRHKLEGNIYPYQGLPVTHHGLLYLFIDYVSNASQIEKIKSNTELQDAFEDYPEYYAYFIKQLENGKF